MLKAKVFPRVGIAAILVREKDGQVLLGQRKSSHGEGR